MKRFQKILFISRCHEQYQNSLYHAIKLAYNNNAEINFLILNKVLPAELSGYENKLKVASIANLEKYIDKACQEIDIAKNKLKMSISINFSNLPDMEVVRKVVKEQYSLIIKSIDEVNQGFKSFDMKLLRNVPCPLWFFRSNNSSNTITKIASAVDANRTDKINISLSEKIITIANNLCNNYASTLDIICCWQPSVPYSAINNKLINIPEEDIQKTQKNELIKLNENIKLIIDSSSIDSKSNFNLHTLEGSPESIIPGFIIDNDIEMLVMGTVNRTGIPGFFIGNTAENVLHKINCSLLALKPEGFISPVKIEN